MKCLNARAHAPCITAWMAMAIFTCALAPPRALAETATEPRGELSLADAISAALRRNPDLRESRYEPAAAQARIVQAALRPNPELGVEFENFAGGGEFAGVDALETTLALSQVLELGGKRAARSAVAEANLGVIMTDQQARELDVLADLTRRYVDVLATQQRVELAHEALLLSERTLAGVELRVEAARSPRAEASRARIALMRAGLESRQAESELRGARAALAALWGSSEPQFERASGDLFSLPPLAPLPALLDAIEQSPDLVRFAGESRLREAELRLAQAQARPNLTLALGVRHFEQTSDTALIAAFAVPLQVFDRNQGAIREARVREAQTQAQRASTLNRTRATLFALYQESGAARDRATILRGEAIPLAQTALAETSSGYQRGRFSYLELLAAQRELLELRAGVIEAASDYHRLIAELERLTAASFVRSDSEDLAP